MDEVRRALLAMPLSRWLGLTVGDLGPGTAQILLPWRPELTQGEGIVAAAVLGQLADLAAGTAAATLVEPGWAPMTVDFTVKIVAPATGPTMIARGRVIEAGRSTSIAAADVHTVGPAAQTGSAVRSGQGAQVAQAGRVAQAGPAAGGGPTDRAARPDEVLCATALVTLRNVRRRSR